MILTKPTKKTIVWEPYDWGSLAPSPIIGVDEAGRGCLAGPVFAGAVILSSTANLEGITDSKKLSESRREELFERILEENQVGIGSASTEEIEALNILNAALLAMKRAVEALRLAVRNDSAMGHVLVDGNQRIKGLTGFVQTTLVKGDLRAAPVAAASIVAKVSRDRLVRELAKDFPLYGFDRHKGYSTADHMAAIAQHGPCLHHRPSFAGVREHWARLRT